MEKHQFTSAELLTIVRRGLFAIDDLYGGGQNVWFIWNQARDQKHISAEDDPCTHVWMDKLRRS